MDLRERIAAATKEAMKSRDAARLSTLRLIGAGIKDREIAARGEPGNEGADGLNGDAAIKCRHALREQRRRHQKRARTTRCCSSSSGKNANKKNFSSCC